MNGFVTDRKRTERAFAEYTSGYDMSDEKVRLKNEHTYRVAELCDKIARSEKACESDIGLAWTTGMLHDVGRFEQLRRYGTFIDAKSIDHAGLGTDIILGDTEDEWIARGGAGSSDTDSAPERNKIGIIGRFVTDSSEDALIETAIRSHSLFRISKDMTQRTAFFCNILRDTDKIDILKVNEEFSLTDIYDVSEYDAAHCRVSDDVMDAFDSCQAVPHRLKKTPADRVVGIISLAFELVFPFSKIETLRQGYLMRLCGFKSEDPVTCRQFERIRAHMAEYMGNLDA